MKHKQLALFCAISLACLLCACATTEPIPTAPPQPTVSYSQPIAPPVTIYSGDGFSFSYDNSNLEVKELVDESGSMISVTKVGNTNTIPRIDIMLMEEALLSAELTAKDFEAFAGDIVKAYYPAAIGDSLSLSFGPTELELQDPAAQSCSTTVTVAAHTSDDDSIYLAMNAHVTFCGNGETGLVSILLSQLEVETANTPLLTPVLDSLILN